MKDRVFIIAEAGVNHNGDLKLAKELIDVAKRADVDAVKFQTFKADQLVSAEAPKADYQQQTTDSKESQLEMIRKLELSEADHRELLAYCRQQNIQFLSTPFDFPSIDFLEELGMEIYKIPSGEITNLPYLRKIGTLNKEIILSTGMANLEEVRAALKILVTAGTPIEKITILHANTEYPTPFEDVNLRAMHSIAAALGVKAGYSDHTLGIEIPTAAVALGACVIEKHFTLDRSMEGPDHKASLEPAELKSMVTAIRHIELAMGEGIKKPSASEQKNIPVARKSIVAARDIELNEIFTENNLTAKRPGTGISPMRWDELIGNKAERSYRKDEQIDA